MSMTSTDASIPSTALRTIVTNLPRPPSNASNTASTTTALQSSQVATTVGAPAKPEFSAAAISAAINAVQKTLLPKLMLLLKPGEAGKAGGASLDSVDLLVETVRCFGVIMTGAEVERAQVAVMELLENDRTPGVIKKRAVTALSLLCVYAPDVLLSSFISHLIESFRTQGQFENFPRLRLLVSVTGALARGIPERFGHYLKQLCPFILSIVNGKDIDGQELGDEPDMERDEVREAALVALESFQSCCTEEMKSFTEELISAGAIYLKYDPNYADPGSDEDDESMGGTQEDGDDDDDAEFGGSDDDDDFEDDGNFSDEDDISWKVRRCAAKLLATVINTQAADLIRGRAQKGGAAYTRLAPLLIERFNEREENVRLEVLATATCLVNKTGEVADGTLSGLADRTAMPPPPKLRRGSDASMMDIPSGETISADETGVRAALSSMVPRLSKSLGKLLNNKSTTLPTKQASITLLSSVVSVLHGGLEEAMSVFLGAIVDMVRGGNLTSGGGVVVATAQGGSAATATGSSVRIEALRLLSKIFENHDSHALAPYLGNLIPAIATAVNEHGYKLSYEALATVASLIILLTDDGEHPDFGQLLQDLYAVVLAKVQSADTDLEVREKAILTLGTILSRTSTKQGWIGPDLRSKALEVLLERLKNETTRITAARAIDGIARNFTTGDEVSAPWLEAVVTECGGQLRKSNRALRATSLETLRSIAMNDHMREHLSPRLKNDLVATLTPLLVVGDMQLLAVSITVIRCMISNPADGIHVSKEVATGICNLVKSNLGSGIVLENLLALVSTIGQVDPKGKGLLMTALLQTVGVTGETPIVAKVVAQLLVSGGGDSGGLGVSVSDFVSEVEVVRDEKRRSLALMILGEIGLRMGNEFTVPPTMFLKQFHDVSENIPLAAAVSLGLAGAGNVQVYVPEIMKRLDGGQDSYLLVHSLKEVIQHGQFDAIRPYASDMWNALLNTAVANEDSKAAAAECVGRLTVLDPYIFLPELKKHLASPDAVVRGMSISALRFTFTDTDATYDELLRPIVVDFLDFMLNDEELENRRLALTALNSAAFNKAHLLAGKGLERLLPRIYSESVIKPELIREIQMGPFRHKVDDGLPVRKSAYETLYSLLETSFRYIDLPIYFERVLAGLGDDHDIRALANLMLGRLAVLTKDETLKRLDVIADAMRKMLIEKPKDNAVKQELERHKEGVRGIVKVAVQLQKEIKAGVSVTGGAQIPLKEWKSFWDWLSTTFAPEIAAAGEKVEA